MIIFLLLLNLCCFSFQGGVEARSVDDAIAVLSIGGNIPPSSVDRHPEKRMKAAYSDFEDRELPRLKK